MIRIIHRQHINDDLRNYGAHGLVAPYRAINWLRTSDHTNDANAHSALPRSVLRPLA